MSSTHGHSRRRRGCGRSGPSSVTCSLIPPASALRPLRATPPPPPLARPACSSIRPRSGTPTSPGCCSRRILMDLIEEYARHPGHADLIRESVDGLVGEGPHG
ncbi:DUF664 domain-containing protein [Streptomyces sp. NPDC058382]|uniref:mycothiol transferase n=1 Tax=unclassified Streptomyces TaxID=2593676 RepID=UPI0036293017